MRIVLDTNVLVSALLNHHGIPARILTSVWAGELELASSQPLLDELQEVLVYPKIRKRLDAHAIDVDLFLELLPFFITTVETGDVAVPTVRDADDSLVLATLIAADADWLVTGDKDLLVLAEHFPILAPAAFVKRFLS